MRWGSTSLRERLANGRYILSFPALRKMRDVVFTSALRRCLVAAGGALALALVAFEAEAAPAASGEPAHVALTVSRTADALDCPDASELAQRIAQARGAESPPPSGRLSARVAFVRDGKEIGARIDVLEGARGTRELRDVAASCDALTYAVAASLAVLVDEADGIKANGELPRSDEAPSPSSTEAMTTSARDAVRPTPPTVKATAPRAVLFAAGGRVAPGLLAGATPGGFIEASLRTKHGASVGLGAFWTPAVSVSLPPGEVLLSLLGGELRGCLEAARFGPVAVRACVSALAGRLRAEGRGFQRDGDTSTLWLAAAAEAGAEGAIAGPVGWAARAGVLTPILRQNAAIEAAGVAWESKIVSPTASAAVTVSIW